MTTRINVWGVSDDLLEVEVHYEDGRTEKAEFNYDESSRTLLLIGLPDAPGFISVPPNETNVVEVRAFFDSFGDWAAHAETLAGYAEVEPFQRPDREDDMGVSVVIPNEAVKIRLTDQLSYLPEGLK